MTNQDRIDIFNKALKISNKYFNKVKNMRVDDFIKGKMPHIVWSEDTVSDIIKYRNKRVAALNFADGYEPGGLVWKGVDTQEEELCRSSNLYLFLSLLEYPIDGECWVSKDVVFFMNKGEKCSISVCDIITCPSVVRAKDMVEVARRMRLILSAGAGYDVLILGKWGCGVFGNEWSEFERLWDECIEEMGWDDRDNDLVDE